MFLKGKCALVTGSTSGIGLAYARALAAEGAALVINGFGEADAIAAQVAELSQTSGAPAIHVDADLTRREGVEALMAAAADEFGGVDILISNAGMQHVAPIEEFPVEKWDAIIALNLTAAFDAARLAVPFMKQRGWGRIIATASAHSLTASPFKAAYVSAKHGLAGLTKTLALELATHGITANCISPGYVWTPLVENQIPDTMAARGLTREQVLNDVMLVRQPTRQFVLPEQVAAMALFLCRDDAAQITGANISMDGGWTAE
jgi:3-hydroxybutyrate dehydrogenase